VKATTDIKVSTQFSGRIIHLNTIAGQDATKNSLIATLRTKEAESLFNSGNRTIKDIKIFSPVSGFVAENYAFQGEIIMAGQPLLRIISPDSIYIAVAIPARFSHKIKNNMLLTILINDKDYETKIDRMIPVTNSATGTFQAFASLQAPDLYPGTICNVILHIRHKTVPAIPRTAVLTRQDHEIAFVVNAGKAEKRILKTGIRTNDFIEVIKGISVGESVVIAANYGLSGGEDVKATQQ